MAQVSGGLLHECLPPEILASIKKHSYDSDTDAYYVEMHNGYRFTVTKEFLVDAEVSSFKIMLYYAQLPSKRSVVRLIDLGEGMLIPKGMAEALDLVPRPKPMAANPYAYFIHPKWLDEKWKSEFLVHPDDHPLLGVEEDKPKYPTIEIHKGILVDPKMYPIISTI